MVFQAICFATQRVGQAAQTFRLRAIPLFVEFIGLQIEFAG
jgi:hypothetical protein